MYALNKDTGKAVWISEGHLKYNYVRPATATINNRYVVFVGGYDQRMNAFDALTGSIVWSYTVLTGWISSSPLIAGSLLYFGNYYGQVTALHVATGALAWVSQVGSMYTTVFNGCYLNDVVYFGTRLDNSLVALNASTGAVLWNSTVPFGGVYGAPAASATLGLVFINMNYGIAALELSQGILKWSVQVLGPADSDVVLVRDTQVVVGRFGGVYAYHGSSGAPLWEFLNPSWGICSDLGAVTIVNGTAYFGVCQEGDEYFTSGVFAVKVPM